MSASISLGRILKSASSSASSAPPPPYSSSDYHFSTSSTHESLYQARRRRGTRRFVFAIVLLTSIMVLFSPRFKSTTRRVLRKASGGLWGGRTGSRKLDSQNYVNGPPTESYIGMSFKCIRGLNGLTTFVSIKII